MEESLSRGLFQGPHGAAESLLSDLGLFICEMRNSSGELFPKWRAVAALAEPVARLPPLPSLPRELSQLRQSLLFVVLSQTNK